MNIKIDGADKALRLITQIPQDVKKQANQAFKKVSSGFVERAVNDAPVNDGLLRRGITFYQESELVWVVVSQASYSAFVEFGTRSKVQIPPDLSSYAAQFKGAGDRKGNFFESILDWVKSKGVAGRFSVKTRKKLNSKSDKEREYQAAYAIYISILRHGSNAHPFFFKQLPWAQAELDKELKQLSNNLNK